MRMKIVRYQCDGKESYGIMQTDRLLSLPSFAKQLKMHLPNTIEAFISDEAAQKKAEELLLKVTNNQLEAASFPLDQAKLLAPITSPPKILCLGLNYATHVNETRAERPKEPVIFMKPHTTIAGPNDKIIKRPFVKQLDYEGELAIVMGKKAKDIPTSQAMGYVFGYTVFNDVSARDFQFRGSQWTPGKSFDTFAPTGPCIVTRSEGPKTDNLFIKTWVNGELRQDGNTNDMIFQVSEIVSYLSGIMTLEPCDLIATGTPSGVAMAMKPPKWLNAGDIVEIEIEGIGKLTNTVEEA
jgi:2-keto-4-pentenoate hydratase/2-oxohepta-3-ene-1,7-dioic acid hydratase in catechol pathway